MSGLSTYLANKILDWLDGTNMPTAPAAVYAAIFNGDPTDAGSGGVEVTTTINAAGRVAVSWGAISGKVRKNDADVDFGTSDGSASATHIAIFDASSGGNMLGSAALPATRTILTGDPVKFATDDLSFDLSSPA
jgi:hypothetical protein